MQLKYYPFCVYNDPYCVYSYDSSINSDYIKRIDPEFYQFISEKNSSIIESEESENNAKLYAALSLRSYYAQGLETLFSLVGATLQAPGCIPGWMIKYRNNQLYELISDIHNNKPIKVRFEDINIVNWETVVKIVFSFFFKEYPEKENDVLKSNSQLLKNLAEDFLDKQLQLEYQSIKHGFRNSAGGSKVIVRETNREGRFVENSEWKSLFNSQYGSSYVIEEKIVNSKIHFGLNRNYVNWNWEQLAEGLILISLFIENLKTFLTTFNKIKVEKISYSVLPDPQDYQSPWDKLVGSGSFKINQKLNLTGVKLISKEEILSFYDQENKKKH